MRCQSDTDLCRCDHARELSAELLSHADLDGDRSLRQQQHIQPDDHGARQHSARDQYFAGSNYDRVPGYAELRHADSD